VLVSFLLLQPALAYKKKRVKDLTLSHVISITSVAFGPSMRQYFMARGTWWGKAVYLIAIGKKQKKRKKWSPFIPPSRAGTQ
jgi:hypothetical protein